MWHFFVETVIGLGMDMGPSLQPNGDEFKFMALGEIFPFFQRGWTRKHVTVFTALRVFSPV